VKFKLDENLGVRTLTVFKTAGHDVQTVSEEHLNGSRDEVLYQQCQREGRCLVTLDLDFSNVLRFPPESTSGVAVLRPSHKPTIVQLEGLARQLLQTLANERLDGRLWIVEPDRVRIHQADE
jgi:predicted nuclease of predicted toxin-antitoxin system